MEMGGDKVASQSKGKATIESVYGYSETVGLGHDRERIAELTPTVADQLDKLSSLWQIDVDGHEMALTFSVIEAWGLEEDISS
jgi:hypothetical protein